MKKRWVSTIVVAVLLAGAGNVRATVIFGNLGNGPYASEDFKHLDGPAIQNS